MELFLNLRKKINELWCLHNERNNKVLSISKSKELKPSGIRRFFDFAAGMEGVISLGVGEPDFVTSWDVREAAIHSLEQGYTSYTANAGLLELRQEISNYMSTQFKVNMSQNRKLLLLLVQVKQLTLP